MINATYKPDEWQLVPKIPTDEMLDSVWGRSTAAYDEMLKAAPQHTMLENFKSPLTRYGSLVRCLRNMADTSLMEMSRATGFTPAQLSAMEFGRSPVTYLAIMDAHTFFASKGIPVTLELLMHAAQHTLDLKK